MSASPLRADMLSVGSDVRYVPQADIAAVLLAQSEEYQRLAIPYLGAGEVYRQNSLVVVHRTIIGSCQRPMSTLGLRCLGRISERRLRWVVWLRPPLPHHPGGKVGAGDGQRAVNDFCSPGSGKSQTTARARTSRLNAIFAAAPQGRFLPCLSGH